MLSLTFIVKQSAPFYKCASACHRAALREGMDYAPGTHLLIDHFGGQFLDDEDALRQALSEAAHAAGAVVLKYESHRFPDRAGVTAFVLLAESHISIHTWPERDYAAIDIFMCGDAQPHKAAEVLEALFKPEHVQITAVERGQR